MTPGSIVLSTSNFLRRVLTIDQKTQKHREERVGSSLRCCDSLNPRRVTRATKENRIIDRQKFTPREKSSKGVCDVMSSEKSNETFSLVQNSTVFAGSLFYHSPLGNRDSSQLFISLVELK